MHSFKFGRTMALAMARRGRPSAFGASRLLQQTQWINVRMLSTNNKDGKPEDWKGFAPFGQDSKETNPDPE